MKQSFALLINSNLNFNKVISLDELVHKTKELFEEEGMPGFLNLVLLMMDQFILMRYAGSCPKGGCCESPYYIKNRREEKHLHTSCGKVLIHWTRVKCKNCRRSFVPLKKYLKIENYARKTKELEKIVVDAVSEQSFRRASKFIYDLSEIKIPATTLHSWFKNTESSHVKQKKRVDTIIGDGTGYKKHPKYGGLDIYENREVRVVIGLDKNGVSTAYGAWTHAKWDEIGEEIRRSNVRKYGDKLISNPIAKQLVSDGEEGLIRGLMPLAKTQQRCQWHMWHDLYTPMRTYDDAPLWELKHSKGRLAEIINIDLPEEELDQISLEDRLKFEVKIKKAEDEVLNLIMSLTDRGYTSAATYLIRAKENLFKYAKQWLKTGIKHPKVSSIIERLMREIGRRIKKIGYNWSPAGAEKMTNIIIKKVTSAKEWDEWWEKRLNFNGAVKLSFEGCVPI